MAEITEYRGVEGLVYAEVTEDTSENYTTGEVKSLAPVAEISRTTESSSETHYYDNQPAVVIESTGADEVTCSVAVIPLDVMADITGQMYDSATGMFIEGARENKYFAIGYKTKKTNGDEVYVWRYKGTFSIPDSTHATEDDGTDANGQEITFTQAPRLATRGPRLSTWMLRSERRTFRPFSIQSPRLTTLPQPVREIGESSPINLLS